LSQGLPISEFEYVVCDGGSDDETTEILKRYDNQIRWISEPDNGQADAVNKGIGMTTGDVIAWINSDDVYYPGAFEKVKAIFETYPDVQAVYGDAEHIDEYDQFIESYPAEHWSYERLIQTCYLCQPAVFFRRELIEKFGGLNAALNYCMDYELWLRYGKCTNFYYLPEKLAGSRLYKSNKTLGQRVAVHHEINDMLHQKFGSVPDKWILEYAIAKVEEDTNSCINDSSQDKQLSNMYVYKSIWTFWHWKKVPSLKSFRILAGCWTDNNLRSLKNLYNRIKLPMKSYFDSIS
jgi:glycosyltransferase involved in cell wall biosynthesis